MSDGYFLQPSLTLPARTAAAYGSSAGAVTGVGGTIKSAMSSRPCEFSSRNISYVRRMPSSNGVFGIGPRSRRKAESSRS